MAVKEGTCSGEIILEKVFTKSICEEEKIMIIAIILLWADIMLYFEKNSLSAYLKAITTWTLYMFFITEILSFIKRLDFISLLLAWLVLDIVLFVAFVKRISSFKYILSGLFTEIRHSFKWYYFILIFIALVSLYFAIRTRPYNFDSMTYHLSRVAHWAKNKSVGHYSTNILRQLASPVLAEFVVTQTYILCRGNDIFVNVIQSTAFITNALIVYGIAKKLKCKSCYCYLASFLYMTMPIAFAESVTTQVDNFAALWMLIFVYFIIDLVQVEKRIQHNSENICSVIILGNCVAFGYLCKPSVSICMVIFAAWLLTICIVRRDNWEWLFRLAVYALPGMLLPIGIEVGRNIYTFGKMSSPLTGARQLIGTWKPAYVFVNCIKNITYNLPNIYDANSPQKITNFVHKLAKRLNVVINDPSISEDGVEFHVWPARMYMIDSAINPIIVTLMLLCIIWIVCNYKKKKFLEVPTGFSIVSIFAFIVFCAVLRLEAFVSRYMISYLALLCIVVCIQIQSIEENGKRQNLSYALVGIIYFCSFVELYGVISFHKTMCKMSTSVSKEESYFINNSNDYEDYAFAANYIKQNGYKNVGFFCGENHYEYPLIKMLGDDVDRFEHIGISGETLGEYNGYIRESLKYEDNSYIPDCIFVIGQYIQDGYTYHNTEYKIAYDYGEGWRYILVHE